jgi:hypothetical protein
MMLQSVITALPVVVKVVVVVQVLWALKVVGAKVADEFALIDPWVATNAHGCRPLMAVVARAGPVHSAEELCHAAAALSEGTGPFVTGAWSQEWKNSWSREVVFRHAGPIPQPYLLWLLVNNLILCVKPPLQQLDLKHVLLDLLLKVENLELVAFSCLRRGRFTAGRDNLASQEVIDIANGHSLAVLFVLFLEMLDPQDVIIFLPDQILHVELAETAAIRRLLLLKKLERACQLFLAVGTGLHLLLFQFVGRAGTLQLNLLQL